MPPGHPFRYDVLEKSCTRLLPFPAAAEEDVCLCAPRHCILPRFEPPPGIVIMSSAPCRNPRRFLLHEVQSESPRSSPNPAVPLMMAKHSRVLSFPRLVSGHFRCPAPPCTLCVQRPMLHGRTARATLSPPTRPAPVPVCDGLPVCSLSLREVFRPAIKPLGSVVASRVPHAPAPPRRSQRPVALGLRPHRPAFSRRVSMVVHGSTPRCLVDRTARGPANNTRKRVYETTSVSAKPSALRTARPPHRTTSPAALDRYPSHGFGFSDLLCYHGPLMTSKPASELIKSGFPSTARPAEVRPRPGPRLNYRPSARQGKGIRK